MTQTPINDKCFGSLIGGAIGDALGYPVEFSTYEDIVRQFGPQGITRLSTGNDEYALFSDDTQMSLFTLEGLVRGLTETGTGAITELLPHIRDAYVDWYRTQTETPRPLSGSWLSYIRALWSRRAPGNTCLSALESISQGHQPQNSSKGCGGVMRVAPIGIFGARYADRYTESEIALLAGHAAALTHMHVESTWASALLALALRQCILDTSVSPERFGAIVRESLETAFRLFDGPDGLRHDFSCLIEKALQLAGSGQPDQECIESIGEGWTAGEAIAIAIFSVCRHTDSFSDCVISAVNHSGDSDSTGAIAGNIIGAILGLHAIPPYFLWKIELRPILQIAAARLTSFRQPTISL